MRISSLGVIFLLATCFILTSCAVNGLTTTGGGGEGRELLGKKDKDKKKKKNKEKLTDDEKREKEALEAYAKEQEQKEKDKGKMLKQAAKDGDEIVNSFSKAILAESLIIADEEGYSNQIAEAVASGLTIIEVEEDADGLLRVILEAASMMDEDKEGRGCYFIGQLFKDAEYYATEMGYLYEFYYAIDDEKYLYIMECFLEECTGVAADCCADEDIVTSGMCSCDKKTEICEYNVFWIEPRVIWLCNGDKCKSDRCLCPVTKEKKSKSSKKSKDKKKKKKKSKGKKVVKKVVKKPKKKTKKSKKD